MYLDVKLIAVATGPPGFRTAAISTTLEGNFLLKEQQ
jgi:hypothetical protein